MTDSLQITLDLVALGAVIVFTGLSFRLASSLKGSTLRRGFFLASLAGLVHTSGNLLTVAGDFGIVASDLPTLVFSLIQASFMILLALAVQSFFPAWYRAFKKGPSNPPSFPGLHN